MIRIVITFVVGIVVYYKVLFAFKGRIEKFTGFPIFATSVHNTLDTFLNGLGFLVALAVTYLFNYDIITSL